MKKICFLGQNLLFMSGCSRVTVSVANNLCKDYDVYLLSFSEPPKEKNYLVDPAVKTFNFGLPNDIRARHTFKYAFKLRRFLIQNNIDVLISSGSFSIPVLSLIAPFVKTKIVFWDHENIAGRDKKSILFRYIGCKISSKVVVLTEQTLEDYKKILNVSENKLAQIYNFVEESEHDAKCDLDSKKIISVGRVSPEKGFDLALEASKLVFEKHPDWQWHIYGDGSDFERISQKSKEYGLENNFILKGSSTSIREKYKDYSICVLPSYREGFAVVLVEAKLNHLPLVSFDCISGPGEIIADGVDGYLIMCYNVTEMSEKICKLIENPELLKSFSSHSKDNIDEFSKEKIIPRWRELIDNI